MASDNDILDAMRSSLREHSDRLDKKFEQMRRESSESSRRLYKRIDEHAKESRSAIVRLGESLARQETTLEHHRQDDETNFASIRKQLEEGVRERGRLWSWILGLGSAGGLGAAATEGIRRMLGGSG